MNKLPSRLLLIEDDANDAALVRLFLRDVASCYPIDVKVASCLRDGLAYLAEEKADVILMDLSLPDSQGLDSFNQLYAYAPETPIIILSGNDDERLAIQIVRSGAQDYIVKGEYTESSLARAITYSLVRKQAEQRLRSLLDLQRALGSLVLEKGEEAPPVSLYRAVYEHVCQVIAADRFIIALYDKESDLIQAQYVVAEGVEYSMGQFPPLPVFEVGQGKRSHVLHADQPCYLPNLAEAARRFDLYCRLSPQGYALDEVQKLEDDVQSVVIAPLRGEGEPLGFISLYNRHADAYTQEDMYFLSVGSGIIAMALRNIALNRWLRQELDERTQQLDKVQEELLKKEKLALIGRLASSIAHEIRNPLGVISNAAYFLKAFLPNADETTREYLTIINEEVHNAAKIVNNLLAYARTKPPQRAPTNLATVVESVLAQYPPPPGVKVLTAVPDDLPALLVDPVQIELSLTNLVVNAYQAMPNGGKLTLQAFVEREGWLKLTVSDDGCGISSEVMGHLFEPLFTTKARGIGLGLAMVHKFVESSGGNIEVHSRANEGSTFILTLPTLT